MTGDASVGIIMYLPHAKSSYDVSIVMNCLLFEIMIDVANAQNYGTSHLHVSCSHISWS